MKWYKIYSKTFEAKTHLVPETLLLNTISSLINRGFQEMDYVELDKTKNICFDLPGMMMLDRNEHQIQIDQLKLVIPSTDVSVFLLEIENLTKRNEIGQDYYKLHANHICICLTPEQKNFFELTLRNILPEAAVIADIENKLFNERMCSTEHPNIVVKPRKTNIGNNAN